MIVLFTDFGLAGPYTGRMKAALRREAIRESARPDDLAEIVYIDHYGNAMTGLRGSAIPKDATLILGDKSRVIHAATFPAMPEGGAFWYENSNGLVEIAVNRGRAADQLRLVIGSTLTIETWGQGRGLKKGDAGECPISHWSAAATASSAASTRRDAARWPGRWSPPR
jgi:S-adenosylmethionine hydrolase